MFKHPGKNYVTTLSIIGKYLCSTLYLVDKAYLGNACLTKCSGRGFKFFQCSSVLFCFLLKDPD